MQTPGPGLYCPLPVELHNTGDQAENGQKRSERTEPLDDARGFNSRFNMTL